MAIRITSLLVSVLLISGAIECKDATKGESDVVRYAKAINVQELDRDLPSQQLDDWLTNGPPKLEALHWTASGCDIKPEPPEPTDGWPLCARIGMRRQNLGGYINIAVGRSRAGIHGEPRFQFAVVTSSALLGKFWEVEKLSDLPRLLAEAEAAANKAQHK